LLNFGGHPDYHLDAGIVFRIRHYWEIRKVVNGHKAAAHTDSPDGVTGGGMHCPSASDFAFIVQFKCKQYINSWLYFI